MKSMFKKNLSQNLQNQCQFRLMTRLLIQKSSRKSNDIGITKGCHMARFLRLSLFQEAAIRSRELETATWSS